MSDSFSWSCYFYELDPIFIVIESNTFLIHEVETNYVSVFRNIYLYVCLGVS